MIKTNKFKRYLSAFMLVLFVVYYADVTLFSHAHTINGVTIIHSHFYAKGHITTDSHTESELTLISVLSYFLSLPVLFTITGLILFIAGIKIIFCSSDQKTPQKYAGYFNLRAPPVIY